MTKGELIDGLHQQTALPKKDISSMLEALGTVVGSALKNGETVQIGQIGKLFTSRRAQRSGRNPRTGEAVTIAAKTVAKFKASKAIEDAIAA